MIQYKKCNIDLKYFCAIAICLFFVMTRYFCADFFDNEWIYSLNPIKLLDREFLSNDFFMKQIFPFFLFYDILTLPFYYFFDALTAVLILRVLIWTFQIWALSRLTRTLEITWWSFILLFVVWLNVEQTLVAGEWIFRSANAKPVSYGFVFLALDSLLKGKLKRTGAFCGLAISFHVLVGLWSTMALFCAIISTRYKSIQVKKVISFCIVVAVLVMPGLTMAIYGEFLNHTNGNLSIPSSEVALRVARHSVLIAIPFHLDPKYFMTGLEYLKVGLFFLLPVLMMNYLLPKEKARPLIVFIFFLFIFFILGLVSRYAEWYRFLKYYPFRVADAFLPLSFWLAFVLLSQKIFCKLKWKAMFSFLLIVLVIGLASYLIELCEPKPRYALTPKSLAKAMLRTEPRLTAYWIRERGKEWYKFFFNREISNFEEMAFWIRESTPKDSVFIVPPWATSFHLNARRSMFVTIAPPPNADPSEWSEKVKLLNRGPLSSVGWGVYRELMQNYPQLTENEILHIKQTYGADYILITSEANFRFEVVHENKSFSLYKL